MVPDVSLENEKECNLNEASGPEELVRGNLSILSRYQTDISKIDIYSYKNAIKELLDSALTIEDNVKLDTYYNSS